MIIVSKPRAARRRRERYAARGMADPARLYELNCERKLPKDHSSADQYDDTDSTDVNIWGDTDEEGVRRREPIIHHSRPSPPNMPVRGPHRGLQTHRSGAACPSGLTTRAYHPNGPHGHAPDRQNDGQVHADGVL